MSTRFFVCASSSIDFNKLVRLTIDGRMLSKSTTSSRRLRSKSGVAPSPSRAVTPSRTNSRSLDPKVQAQLILDVNRQPGRDPELYTFVWHPKLFKGFNRDKVRKRFWYIVEHKCSDKANTFPDSVQWAIEYKREHPEKFIESDYQ